MPDEDFIHTTFSHNPFAMFAPQPVGVSFENQEKGEKIILLLRAHIATLVPPAVVTIILIFVPLIALPSLNFLKVDISSFLTPGQLFLITIFWYLFIFGYAFYQFIFWYFNVYLVTNERIIDFDFNGLLNKEISFAELNKIQDVSPKIVGFFGTFFHYGDIYIQTAAERPEFEFRKVARPDTVAQEILEQVRKEEAEPPGVIA